MLKHCGERTECCAINLRCGNGRCGRARRREWRRRWRIDRRGGSGRDLRRCRWRDLRRSVATTHEHEERRRHTCAGTEHFQSERHHLDWSSCSSVGQSATSARAAIALFFRVCGGCAAAVARGCTRRNDFRSRGGERGNLFAGGDASFDFVRARVE